MESLYNRKDFFGISPDPVVAVTDKETVDAP